MLKKVAPLGLHIAQCDVELRTPTAIAMDPVWNDGDTSHAEASFFDGRSSFGGRHHGLSLVFAWGAMHSVRSGHVSLHARRRDLWPARHDHDGADHYDDNAADCPGTIESGPGNLHALGALTRLSGPINSRSIASQPLA